MGRPPATPAATTGSRLRRGLGISSLPAPRPSAVRVDSWVDLVRWDPEQCRNLLRHDLSDDVSEVLLVLGPRLHRAAVDDDAIRPRGGPAQQPSEGCRLLL